MGQDTVFRQIVKLIPRDIFESSVRQHEGDKGIRSLNCWTWFGALLFGQMTGHDSIRAIERVFAYGDKQLSQLGFGEVKKSTLADANQSRPLAILVDVYEYVLRQAMRHAPKKTSFRFKGPVFALDSTTIELCLSLCPWALFHHSKGAVKLHTAIDIASHLPLVVVVTDGRCHDVKAAKNAIEFAAGTTVIMDRAYVDYGWLNTLDTSRVHFVTRAKKNCQFTVIESHKTNRTRGHICDQTIKLKSQRGQAYEGYLRRIRYKDPDTGKSLAFLTNRFDLAVQTICDLYKSRWQVELFFKTIKQNLRIKKFIGTTAHAVQAQILVALIAYVLVQTLRFLNNANISIPDAMAVIGTLLLLRQPLSRLLGQLPRTTRHPPPIQLSLGF